VPAIAHDPSAHRHQALAALANGRSWLHADTQGCFEKFRFVAELGRFDSPTGRASRLSHEGMQTHPSRAGIEKLQVNPFCSAQQTTIGMV
jgi:hypothetical protein